MHVVHPRVDYLVLYKANERQGKIIHEQLKGYRLQN